MPAEYRVGTDAQSDYQAAEIAGGHAMKNLLAQLESNEVVLLMYMAEELPRKDREEVEHLLERDAGMRAELKRLEEAMGRVEGALKQADEKMTLRESRACEMAGHGIREWLAVQARQKVLAPEKGLPFAWWVYPLVAAAAVFLAASVWIANIEPEVKTPPVPVASGGDLPVWDMRTEEQASADADAGNDTAAEELAMSFDDSEAVLSEASSDSKLFDAMRELERIRAARREAGTMQVW
jgi:hypothetical protein